MHPLTLWMASVADRGEREREQRLLRMRRDSGIAQPERPSRDGLWAAAMHRWAVRARSAPAVAETAPSALAVNAAPPVEPAVACA